MPASPINTDTILGRRVDLLGRVQGVALGNAIPIVGQQTTVFTTDNKDFPGQSIFIAYVGVDLITRVATSDGYQYVVASTGTFDNNLSIDLGSAGGSDWGQGTVGLSLLTTPAILYNAIEGGGTINLQTYGPGVTFTVVNRSTGVSSQFCQVSAYGWSFG